jgi:hypothetical protein
METIHISEEEFVEAINAMKKQLEHDEFFGESMKNAFPGCHAPIYDNHYLWEGMIRLLEAATNDEDKTIEWWIYNAKFGEEPDMNIVEKRNGEEIVVTLSTAEELYNYLKNK